MGSNAKRCSEISDIHALFGGVLSENECQLLRQPESTRALVSEIFQSVRAGRAAAVSDADLSAYESIDDARRKVLLSLSNLQGDGSGQGAADEAASDEDLKRQVAALDSALSATKEQLAKALNRKERMALLEPAAIKENASLEAYEKKLHLAIAAEVEACTAAEVECIEAIQGIDSSLVHLLERIDPSGPFLLPLARLDELSNCNSEFLDSVQSMVDVGLGTPPAGAADGDGVGSMRGVAMQELQRLQDLFVYTELDRTDAMQMKEAALAVETVAQAQLGELAGGNVLSARKKVIPTFRVLPSPGHHTTCTHVHALPRSIFEAVLHASLSLSLSLSLPLSLSRSL